MCLEQDSRRKSERKSVRAVVQMITNNFTDNVVCLDLSMTGGMLLIGNVMNPKTWVTLRFYGSPGSDGTHELFDGVRACIKWYRWKEKGKSLIGVEFASKPNEHHGIPQLLNPDAYTKVKKKLATSNNSLMGRYVRCYVCGHEDTKQWKLRTKTMITKNNIFGIPTYTQPMPGKHHCDYNLLRVTVCPKCYFASNHLDYFQGNREDACPFPVGPFYKKWMENVEERGHFVEQHKGGLFSDIRSLEQALIAYNLAIDTHELLASQSDHYNEQRTVVSQLLFQAELYMSRGDRNIAESNLKRAEALLEETFGHLKKEAILRAALLICLINLYFQDMKKFGGYMTFLVNYNKDGKIHPRSDEGKVLKHCLDAMNKAYEYREDLTRNKLKNFHFQF